MMSEEFWPKPGDMIVAQRFLRAAHIGMNTWVRSVPEWYVRPDDATTPSSVFAIVISLLDRNDNRWWFIMLSDERLCWITAGDGWSQA